MLTLLREVSLRHLRHSPLRTGLVIFGIALGVCTLCAVLAVNDALVAAFEDMVDRVAGKADLTVAGSDAGIPSQLTGEIADLEGVEHAAAMLEVVTRTPDGKGGSLLVLGVDFLGDTFFLPFAQDGDQRVVEDPLVFVNEPTAVLISEKLARARGLKVGDALPLVTNEGSKTFYVRGLLKDEGPASSFGGQVVVMFIDAAQISFQRGYAVDRIDIVVEKGADLKDVQARIAKLVAGRAQVEAPQGRTQRLVASLWAFKNGLNMSGVVSLWVGMFLIYNAVSISVAQRRREVGILRALGVTKRRMTLLFCLEALVMGAIGVGVGLVLAQQLADIALASVTGAVDRFFMPSHPTRPTISPNVALAGAVAGMVTTLIASYGPARATNRVDPAEALRASRASASMGSVRYIRFALIGTAIASTSVLLAYLGGESNGYLACGVLITGLSLLVPLIVKLLRAGSLKAVERLLGIPGRIALDNVERSLSRTTITVVALMLAVGMSMSVGAYATSFEKSILSWADEAFGADAMISAGSPLLDRHHMPFAASFLDRFKEMPEVAAVSPYRVTFIDHNGRRAQVASTDTRIELGQLKRKGRGRRVLDGPGEIETSALYERQRVLISENMANIHHLSAGDTLRLDTPTGGRDFEVYAVVVDYSFDQGWLMMDRRWYKDFWSDDQIDAVNVFFVPGIDHEALVEVLRNRLAGPHNLFITLHEGMRKEMQNVAQTVFSYAKAPELIALIVAIMGVIGTMLAAVIDRIREIGMLRAIGATRSQVVWSLVAEAGFLGFASVICGVLAGVPQGYIFLKVIGTATSGWNLPYGFPTETALRMGLFVVGAAAVSGFFPGKRAAGLDVKEALSYE